DLRRDLDDVRVVEARRHALDELEDVPALATPLDFAIAQLPRVDAADRGAVRVLDLGEIRTPLDRIALRAHDRLLAREPLASLLGLFHQGRNQLPGAAGTFGIDAVDPEHRRRVQHVARAVADLVRRTGPRAEIAVAGRVDEDPAPHREATGLRLDQE